MTIVTRVIPGREASLLELLHGIGNDVEGSRLVPFPELKTLHFGRWAFFEGDVDALGTPTPPTLILSTNFDAPRQAHIAELYDRAKEGIDLIYEHCEGYPLGPERTPARVRAWLEDHDAGYNTLYVGTRGRTVDRIQREANLRDAIQGFLDEACMRPGFQDQSPAAIRAEIQASVQSHPELAWATETPPTGRSRWPTRRDLPLALAAAALVLVPLAVALVRGWRTGAFLLGGILGVLLLAAGLWALMLRRKERTDPEDPPTEDFDHVRSLTHDEDRFVQNQMSAVNRVKPGRLRLFTLRLVLAAIDLLGRWVYTHGSLGSIPSIHFARWVVIDGGRRVVFFSNFDGSWENYLGDFIDKAAVGLTGVWSNTAGFPRSRWLILDGATDEQRFKAYARRSQAVTPIWYSAYKWLSVQNINNNSAIRAGLFGEQTPDETAAWLWRL